MKPATKPNKYKIEKIGVLWCIFESHYAGWWIFKKKIWLATLPYYWHKEDAEQSLKEILNSN